MFPFGVMAIVRCLSIYQAWKISQFEKPESKSCFFQISVAFKSTKLFSKVFVTLRGSDKQE
jgi:hypothetical protein